ncbi:beta-lactamase class A [Desulfocurvibacter africanus PCS]|uniref:beta-lactamase n=1 Tax=Desulfocurvibacter africanus PCS TaxID=1262666 RepID=M5PQV6_DESAF|nr:beta-lactamase class A [Desulfocurvibacter africanus PCS]
MPGAEWDLCGLCQAQWSEMSGKIRYLSGGVLAASLFLMLAATSVLASSGSEFALLNSRDSVLQHGLEERIRELGLNKAKQEGRLAACLVDVTDPAHPRLAMVNGERMMYAASLPKIAILLAAFEKADQGGLSLGQAERLSLARMIRRSSNTDATAMLAKVGRDYLIDVLESERYRLYDPAGHGGLWVGKEYGKAAAYRRDPLAGLSHGATAFQVARFYYLLHTGQLVSPERCAEMKTLLANSALNHKFVAGLRKTCPTARVYRKSGSWSVYHSDSALVEHDGRTYIAVALTADPDGSRWLEQLITAMDELVMSNPLPEHPSESMPQIAEAPKDRTEREIMVLP